LSCNRLKVGLRHQLDAGREQLAEFHERGPQFLEIVGKLTCFRLFLGRRLLLGVEGFLEAALLDEIGPAILREKPRDLAVAGEMLRFQGDGHGRCGASRARLRPSNLITQLDP